MDGESLTLAFELSGAATYELTVRTSNDNFGELETVRVEVDGVFVGQFQPPDTGDFGLGWNVFASNDPGSIALGSGTHSMTLSVSGGDGFGVEVDVVTLDCEGAETPPSSCPEGAGPIELEGEDGDGPGVIFPRGAASRDATALLLEGESLTLAFELSGAATYELTVRTSNDNFGELETVRVEVDGVFFGQFQPPDTGDFGFGWNVFASNDLGSIALASGTHSMTLSVSGGDGFGVEVDIVTLTCVVPTP